MTYSEDELIRKLRRVPFIEMVKELELFLLKSKESSNILSTQDVEKHMLSFGWTLGEYVQVCEKPFSERR